MRSIRANREAVRWRGFLATGWQRIRATDAKHPPLEEGYERIARCRLIFDNSFKRHDRAVRA